MDKQYNLHAPGLVHGLSIQKPLITIIGIGNIRPNSVGTNEINGQIKINVKLNNFIYMQGF